ncbi:MAG TPA: hypothetical protein VHX14_08510 [Thermoanaerobaculia bacterium]|jgi:hypothetical protein|nr:hypothetical protein [Thermoanaerobaculia bacterium]
MTRPSFGDHVKIRITEATEAAGIAGLEGSVSGFTTPSVTNVEVIGKTQDDYALSVMIEARNDDTFWLAEELVEFLDHAPNTEIWVTGASFKEVRNADGSWRQVPLPRRRRWWQFW